MDVIKQLKVLYLQCFITVVFLDIISSTPENNK